MKSFPLRSRIVKFYRGWRDFVAAQESWEASRWVMINDLSQLKEPADKFSSYEQILSTLSDLIAECDPGSETHARLKQSEYFLTQSNEPGNLAEAVKARGIPLVDVSDDFIDQLHNELKVHCQAVCGDALAWKNGHPAFVRSVSATAAARAISESGRKWLDTLHHRFEWAAPCSFKTQVIEGEKSWVNMITTEDQNIQLIVNSGVALFAPSHIELLALHEIAGHVFHFNQILNSKSMQENSPHLCCFTIHNQDAYLIEGIAMFMTYALTERYSPEPSMATIGRLRFDLWLAIRHSLMLKLINGKMTIDQAVEKHADYMGERELIRRHYQATMKSVLFAIQGLCYISPYFLLRPASKLNDNEFNSFVKNLVTTYHSPSKLKDLTESFNCA